MNHDFPVVEDNADEVLLPDGARRRIKLLVSTFLVLGGEQWMIESVEGLEPKESPDTSLTWEPNEFEKAPDPETGASDAADNDYLADDTAPFNQH
jgi:hypothetical protein